MTDWVVGIVAWLATLLGEGEDPACLLLGRLDAERVVALQTARPGMLAEVYADDRLAHADASVLRGYTERGLRLRGGALVRIECRVTGRDASSIRLDVVDRLGRTWVIDASGRRRELPRASPTRRAVTLTETSEGWRISASR
ncbi:hypothetical protein ACHAAC_17390 [Aeromicrobium sp. CF4.19]|uniref:hypothetical protein n=1 Tax=Aeromicrobium sp. CF4.19 TaxID=3373082 RepID=UPI003EE62EA9